MNNPPLILLADDNPDDQSFIRDAFAYVNANVRLKILDSGVELLHHLKILDDEDLPSLIVLDYNMPRTNGAEALSWLRRGDTFKDIPIVLYSSNMSSLLACKLSLMGAHCCFQKPRDVNGGVELARTLKMIAERPAVKA